MTGTSYGRAILHKYQEKEVNYEYLEKKGLSSPVRRKLTHFQKSQSLGTIRERSERNLGQQIQIRRTGFRKPCENDLNCLIYSRCSIFINRKVFDQFQSNLLSVTPVIVTVQLFWSPFSVVNLFLLLITCLSNIYPKFG